MRKLLAVVAMIGFATTPLMAQTAPQPQPAEKPKTVTKIVCERVSAEQTTGSRLGSAPKKCKKVEVPATDKDAQKSQPQAHSAHAH